MMMMETEMDVTPSVVLPEIFLAYLLSCFVWTGRFHSLYTAESVCVCVCAHARNLLLAFVFLRRWVAPYGVVCSGLWLYAAFLGDLHGAEIEFAVTRLQAGWLWNLCLIPCRWEELWGPPSLQWVPRSVSPAVKWLGCGPDHSPLSGAEVQNAWSYPLTHPHIIMHAQTQLYFATEGVQPEIEYCHWDCSELFCLTECWWEGPHSVLMVVRLLLILAPVLLLDLWVKWQPWTSFLVALLLWVVNTW